MSKLDKIANEIAQMVGWAKLSYPVSPEKYVNHIEAFVDHVEQLQDVIYQLENNIKETYLLVLFLMSYQKELKK